MQNTHRRREFRRVIKNTIKMKRFETRSYVETPTAVQANTRSLQVTRPTMWFELTMAAGARDETIPERLASCVNGPFYWVTNRLQYRDAFTRLPR